MSYSVFASKEWMYGWARYNLPLVWHWSIHRKHLRFYETLNTSKSTDIFAALTARIIRHCRHYSLIQCRWHDTHPECRKRLHDCRSKKHVRSYKACSQFFIWFYVSSLKWSRCPFVQYYGKCCYNSQLVTCQLATRTRCKPAHRRRLMPPPPNPSDFFFCFFFRCGELEQAKFEKDKELTSPRTIF